MQPIVIATDFSPASDQAMLYAGALAGRMNCELVLVNVYNFPIVPTSEVPVVMMPYGEFHTQSENGLKKSKQKLLASYPNLLIETKSALGEVSEQLDDELEGLDPLLLVIGSRKTTESGKVFGSTAVQIIRNCRWPVLAIPEDAPVAPPRVAILATDLAPIRGHVLGSLRMLVETLQLDLHLVHVVQSDRNESHEEVMRSLSDLRADFKTVISQDLSEGIESYTKELNADLVITLPHAHSWLENLFIKKHTKELVNELHIPLLCIPEK